MRPKPFALALAVITAAVACLLTGCPQPQAGSSAGDSLLAASSANAASVTSAVSKAGQMLQQGSDATTINAALLTQLQGDSRVVGSGLDPTGETVWADFIGGESHCFLVVDQSKDTSGTLKPMHPIERPRAPGTDAGCADIKTIAQQPTQPATGRTYTIPGNSRALLANSLSFIHSNWSINDSTELIEKMLKARGYTTERHNLTIDDFTKLTDYGVIVLEGHGQWRNPQYAPELLQLPPALGIPNTGTCGGAFSRVSVLTTTKVTEQNLVDHAGDVGCGRLVLWNVTILQPDGKIAKVQYYGVTPNYVREYDSGKFPKNTIFLMNACRGIRGDLSSPFADLLFEKCDQGACFLGWSGKVEYAKAARAALYLFQLMTCANEEKKVMNIYGVEKTVLQKFTPPQGGGATWMLNAMAELNQQLYLTDLASGAQLTPLIQSPGTTQPMLVPHPLSWSGPSPWQSGAFALGMFSDAQPAITIGGTSVSASEINYWANVWNISAVPSGAYGDIVIKHGNISSIPRPLRRWQPSITVKGNSDGLAYTVTFTLLARGTVANFRTSVWQDPPPATFFDAEWIKAGSIIAWNITGQKVTQDYRYDYSGSGSRAFGANDGGYMTCASDGSSVSLSASGEVTYTTTTTNLKTQNVSTSNNSKAISISRNGVSLSSNWTISDASFTQGVGFSDQAQVSWNAIAADPPFDPNAEPR